MYSNSWKRLTDRSLLVVIAVAVALQALLIASQRVLEPWLLWSSEIVLLSVLGVTLVWMARRYNERDVPMDAIPGAILRLDSEGIIRGMNAAAENLLESLSLGAHLPSRLEVVAAQQLQAALLMPPGTSIERLEFEAKIGERRYRFALASESMHNGIRAAQVTDITEFRLISEQVVESEQRFRSLFSENPDAVFSLSLEGRFVDANHCTLELTDFSLEELINCEWESVVPEEDQQLVRDSFERVLRGCPSHFDCRIISRSGSVSRVAVTHIPIYVGGEMVGVFGIAKDKTETYRVEERSRLLRACVAKIQDVVIITETNPLDEPGPRIIFANEAAEAMTGYRPEELIGKTPRLFQGPETDRVALDRIRAALTARQRVKEVLLNYCKDGQPYWNEVEIVPLAPTSPEEPEYFASIQRDITQVKQRELELRRSQMELRRLTSAQHSLLEKERRRIARDLHDELGQSLTAMKFNMSMALPNLTGLSEKERQGLQTSINKIDGIIDQVRKISANLRPAMLDDLGFEAAAEWFLGQVSDREALDVRWLPKLEGKSRAQGDLATALYRILQECMTNITRHAQASEVNIEYLETDTQAKLEVVDNGIGFYPGASDTEGFGVLGMRERVAMLGGQFIIESAIDRGTRVFVTLPFGS